MRRKDKPPKGVGKDDLLSLKGMEPLDGLTRKVLEVSKEEIERREANDKDEPITTQCYSSSIYLPLWERVWNETSVVGQGSGMFAMNHRYFKYSRFVK